MSENSFKTYRYRWIVLLSFMLIVIANQLLWITFAPITSSATRFYSVSDLAIGLLSMSFMIVFILFSIPASWVIDSYGIKVGVGIGAVLTGIFGLMRGLFPANYTFVLIAQIGIAIGQPFILNAITAVAARWFPLQERATAAGLGTLAIYVGIIVGMAATPFLVISTGMGNMLIIYGIIAAIAAAAFLLVAKERPPTPPCPPEQEERSLMLDGLKDILRNKTFLWLMLIFFVGLGIFNGVTTWIEEIVRPRGFTITQAGTIGGLMVVGGVIGAAILPSISDRAQRRVPFMVISLTGATIGLIGITFADRYPLLLISAFTLGFFLLSSGPIGFQYGAEITFPAPEGTSNGFLLLMGQIAGIAFIFGMDSLKAPSSGSMTLPLELLIGLLVVGLLLCMRLPESPLLRREVVD